MFPVINKIQLEGNYYDCSYFSDMNGTEISAPNQSLKETLACMGNTECIIYFMCLMIAIHFFLQNYDFVDVKEFQH